jgi:DNA-directed RNA polymerase specialized sigma24 family protein
MPDEAAYARLLTFLDADPQRAVPKFNEVRRRLLKLFAWRECAPPETYARRTIDRVARRISEGNDRHVAEPFQYFYGVAMHVLKEGGAPPSRVPEPQPTQPEESADPGSPPAADPELVDAARRKLTCVESCLGELLPKHRALLLDYHRSATDLERYDDLAHAQGIPLNALRLRVHRLRASVERSVTRCLARRADGLADASPH